MLANSKILASIKFGQYSSASMMVSTCSVTAVSAVFGEWWVSMESHKFDLEKDRVPLRLERPNSQRFCTNCLPLQKSSTTRN